jgi:hypothetical protein
MAEILTLTMDCIESQDGVGHTCFLSLFSFTSGCLENSTFPRVDRIALFKLKASSRVADPILARLDEAWWTFYCDLWLL